MPRSAFLVPLLFSFVAVQPATASTPPPHPAVTDRSQTVVRTRTSVAATQDRRPGSGTSQAPHDPESGQRLIGPAPECTALDAPPGPGLLTRETRHSGYRVDACGRVLPEEGYTGPLPSASPGSSLSRTASGGATIDSMTVGSYYEDGFTPFTGLSMMGGARTYYLDNGTSWTSGAGSYRLTRAQFVSAEVVGTRVRYTFNPPPDNVLYEQTDYNGGDHSAQGVLALEGPLVLEAVLGTSVARISGLVRIASNDATWYGEPRFNFYTALPGSVVPFILTYTLNSGTWNATTFNAPFSYLISGSVDFVHAVSGPEVISLEISGPSQVPERSTAQYSARAFYEGGVEREVTNDCEWTVTPASLATVNAGQLITLDIPGARADLELFAGYSFGGVTREARLNVVCRADLFTGSPTDWPTYQANARHDGYVPLSLAPEEFQPAWSVTLRTDLELNPVTGAEGRVFCSTLSYFGSGEQFFALDARDGHVMWSKSYAAFSVNPPSAAYGNAYIQTGNHASDTWLHAYDGATGRLVFSAPHAAQWERYFAPTPFAGRMYLNGGYYGGMYSFDALSGGAGWFLGLPQYDQWTPAVDSSLVYAYVGEYNPGLYVAHRSDGTAAFMIPDANFDWDGWSMNLAPVLGAHNDVVVVHDGRLIRFDLTTRRIAWQLARSFAGQPSVAHDLIFAINGGRLDVFDEMTGLDRWSWAPPSGALRGSMIVTDTHLFAATGEAVYAVNLATHESEWSYPVAGHLALANGQLYVAASNGVLTAITVAPAPPVDTTPPTLTVNLNPTVLWPPNGRLVAIHATVTAEDSDDPSPAIQLVRIVSSEPDSMDIQGADFGTADFDFLLQAERNGTGTGRSYTICYRAEDEAGNSSEACASVIVPHDQARAGRAALVRSMEPPSLTLFGSTTHDPRTISTTSITVESGEATVLSAMASPVRSDMDGDGFEDATFALARASADPVEGTVLWARWRSSGKDYLASLPSNVLDAGDARAPISFSASIAPNPASGGAALYYTVPSAGPVRVEIFDVAGRLVATLADEMTTAGRHVARFGGVEGNGGQLYLYRVQWQDRSVSGKFLLLR